jgi:predicted PurR-regulated permease PerM
VLITLGAVLVGLGFWFVFRFYDVAFILFSALVLGTVIRPVVDWLNCRGVSGVGRSMCLLAGWRATVR